MKSLHEKLQKIHKQRFCKEYVQYAHSTIKKKRSHALVMTLPDPYAMHQMLCRDAESTTGAPLIAGCHAAAVSVCVCV
jgi:hypothetical protein